MKGNKKVIIFEAIIAAHLNHLWPGNRLLQPRYYNIGSVVELCRTQDQLLCISDNDT